MNNGPLYSRGEYSEQEEQILNALPAPCPHCGGVGIKKSKWVSYQSERSGMRSSKKQLFFWQCELCLAQGGASEDEDQALLNWNARPSRVWVPLPTWTASFLLPPDQLYTHLMVHDRGNITLVEYGEEAQSPSLEAHPEEVLSQTDVDLGKYRICILRPPMQIRRLRDERGEESGAASPQEQGSPQTRAPEEAGTE